MNARIDIKTPSGIPVEGFPKETEVPTVDMGEEGTFDITETEGLGKVLVDSIFVKLHPGDQIIIEVLA